MTRIHTAFIAAAAFGLAGCNVPADPVFRANLARQDSISSGFVTLMDQGRTSREQEQAMIRAQAAVIRSTSAAIHAK